MNGETYRRGDRVVIVATGEFGTVHEIWPGGEDTVEIRLDSGPFIGAYVHRDPHHLVPASVASGEGSGA